MPGLVNTHAHIRDERAGRPQPVEYLLDLLLAGGQTTVRNLGTDFEKAKRWRAASATREMAAPRILVYPWALGVVSQGIPSRFVPRSTARRSRAPMA